MKTRELQIKAVTAARDIENAKEQVDKALNQYKELVRVMTAEVVGVVRMQQHLLSKINEARDSIAQLRGIASPTQMEVITQVEHIFEQILGNYLEAEK